MTFDEAINKEYAEYIAVKTEIEKLTKRKNELVNNIKELQETKESYEDGLCREAGLCNCCLKKHLCEAYADIK